MLNKLQQWFATKVLPKSWLVIPTDKLSLTEAEFATGYTMAAHWLMTGSAKKCDVLKQFSVKKCGKSQFAKGVRQSCAEFQKVNNNG